MRYTPSGGEVDVSLTLRDGRSVVEILDTDPGLGLAIARRIAKRNGLVLTVENRPDGSAGVLARATFPA